MSNMPATISRMAIGRPTLMPSFLLGDFIAGVLITIREGPMWRISVPLSSLFMSDSVMFWVAISGSLGEFQLLRDIIAKPAEMTADLFVVAPVLLLFWAKNCISMVLLGPGKAIGSQMARYRCPLGQDEYLRH